MITVFYTDHDPRELDHRFRRVLDGEDIVVITEDARSDSYSRALRTAVMQEVSNGHRNPRELRLGMSEEGYRLLDMLHGTGKEIFLEGPSMEEQDIVLIDSFQELAQAMERGSGVLDKFGSYLRSWASRVARGDEALASHVTSVTEDRPGKDILVVIGKVHRKLLDELRERDEDVKETGTGAESPKYKTIIAVHAVDPAYNPSEDELKEAFGEFSVEFLGGSE